MARLQENNPEAYQRFIEERLPRKIMGEAKELIPMSYCFFVLTRHP